MASGRLKVVRVLGNPKPRGKKKRKATAAPKKPRTKRSAKRVRAIGTAPRYALRVVDSASKVLWWNGHRWTSARIKAATFSREGAAAKLAVLKKPAGWIVADAIAA